jgi:rhamnosyltransferase
VERSLTERTGVGAAPGSSPPKVSVVIPTLNAGPGFGDLLAMLSAQETGFGYEVLVIDSGSTDGTVELARRYGAVVYTFPRSEFGHGATRNLGISLSRGEYVAFVVQDAVPLDGLWLAVMVENLEGDDLVAGVYGRQVPRPESAPLARALVNGWPTASLERREQYVEDPALYRELTPAGRRSLATFDNVSSCVRRSVWEEIPFERTGYGGTSGGARASWSVATGSSTSRARPCSTPTNAAPSTTCGATTWTERSSKSSSTSRPPRTCLSGS